MPILKFHRPLVITLLLGLSLVLSGCGLLFGGEQAEPTPTARRRGRLCPRLRPRRSKRRRPRRRPHLLRPRR